MRRGFEMCDDIGDGLGAAQDVMGEVEQRRIGHHRYLGHLDRCAQQGHVAPRLLPDPTLRLLQHLGTLFDANDLARGADALLQLGKAQARAAATSSTVSPHRKPRDGFAADGPRTGPVRSCRRWRGPGTAPARPVNG
ncbi:hypothetical protein LP417_28290 [Polaromonas sp. P1-6]|nr:hypothetical protein LP417_28290 [Polaromonas sp. P1-6]